MPSSFDIGDVVRLSTVVKDRDGVVAVPGSITLKLMLPDQTLVTPTPLVNDGTGLYHYDYDVTQAGAHTYRWTTTGNAKASDERVFFVRQRVVA